MSENKTTQNKEETKETKETQKNEATKDVAAKEETKETKETSQLDAILARLESLEKENKALKESGSKPGNDYGLTENERLLKQKDDNKKLARMQTNEDVELMAGNKKPTYKFPVTEKDFIHLECETIQVVVGSKKNNVITRVLKMTPKMFEAKEKRRSFNHFDGVNILHDPR